MLVLLVSNTQFCFGFATPSKNLPSLPAHPLFSFKIMFNRTLVTSLCANFVTFTFSCWLWSHSPLFLASPSLTQSPWIGQKPRFPIPTNISLPIQHPISEISLLPNTQDNFEARASFPRSNLGLSLLPTTFSSSPDLLQFCDNDSKNVE